MKEINNLLERIRTAIDNEPLLKETDKILFKSILIGCAAEQMADDCNDFMMDHSELRSKIKKYKYEQTVEL